jgi:16S rRNA (guanine527-N7)-methyltransferase
MDAGSPKTDSISLKALWEGLDSAAKAKLDKYAELIFHYRDVARLTAMKTVDEVREVLVAESLALMPMLQAGSGDVADFGSGSGIPGIPLAIALPGTQFILYERSARKAGFLLIALGALGITNIAVAQDDPLRMDPALQYPRVVTRASATPDRLGEIAAKMLVDGGEMLGFLSGAMEQGFSDKLPTGLRLIELRGYTGASRSGFVYRLKWEAAVK